jgi:hypothetical protein
MVLRAQSLFAEATSLIAKSGRALLGATIIAPATRETSSVRSPTRLVFHPFVINLLSFFTLSLVAFRDNAPYLFYAYDGQFEVTLITLDSLFVPPQIGLTNNYLQGLGNVWFALNPKLFLEYLLVAGAGEFTNFALAYAISATQLFAGTFLLARMIGVSWPAALIASWALPLLTFQFVGWPLIWNIFRYFPHYATVAAISVVTAGLLLLIGVSPPRKAVILGVVTFFAIAYVVIAAPTLLILAAPQCAVFGLVSLVAAAQRRHLWAPLAVMSAILLLCVAAGFAFYIQGLTAFTAASFFRDLSIRPAYLFEASLLLWNPVTPRFFTIERTFLLLGLLGGFWAMLRGSGTLRLAALAFVCTASLYLAVGVLHAHHPFWFGPSTLYFENFLLPFYSIFAALLCFQPAHVLAAAIGKHWGQIPPRAARAFVGLVAVSIATLPWLHVSEQRRVFGRSLPPYHAPFPQPSTPITAILKQEIALKPGEPFRGRVATVTGRIFAPSMNVDLRRPALADVTNHLAMFETGNSHTAAGLWQDSVPTLLEYNHLMTPAYFVFCRFFFTEPIDQQWRNTVMMRRIDPRLLAGIGVRFIVTDAPFEGAAHLRQTLDVPVREETLKRMGARHPVEGFTLYLYELPSVNVGQYSPTEIVTRPTASRMLDLLAQPSTDLTRTAVTSESIDEKLVPARLSQFVVNKGSLAVKAASSGWSLLLLPVEYSRCLQVRANGPDAEKVRLLRANLLLTVVLFKEQLDAQITYHTGPFVNSRCRLEDARDMEKIEIKGAFDRRPELAPTPIMEWH